MRKLTRKESLERSWWFLLVFLTLAWALSFLLGGFTRDTLIAGVTLSVIAILAWILTAANSIWITTIKCQCGMMFSRELKNYPRCNLEVPAELQK